MPRLFCFPKFGRVQIILQFTVKCTTMVIVYVSSYTPAFPPHVHLLCIVFASALLLIPLVTFQGATRASQQGRRARGPPRSSRRSRPGS
ncbi:hypothetical protein DFH11DRAFT_1620290 [Phellopilus nigrolimitatus]|nr:hypothetical protein DFH11DRAFT_1620290 [Phellopilus nigrolimitatus]